MLPLPFDPPPEIQYNVPRRTVRTRRGTEALTVEVWLRWSARIWPGGQGSGIEVAAARELIRLLEQLREGYEERRVFRAQFGHLVHARGGAAVGLARGRIEQPNVLDTEGEIVVDALAYSRKTVFGGEDFNTDEGGRAK